MVGRIFHCSWLVGWLWLVGRQPCYIGYVRDSIFAFDRFDKFDDFDNIDNYEDDLNRCNNLHVRFDKFNQKAFACLASVSV